MQEALGRMHDTAGLQVRAPILIASARHSDTIREQLESEGRSPLAVVLEPFARNTAPAAAMAALLAEEVDPTALVLLMSADHKIGDDLMETVAEAAAAAAHHIVVFGVTPTAPETGYGYIKAGEVIDGPVRKVVNFAEKPDLATAKAYLEGGRHLWNAGMFLFSPAVLLSEMEKHAPRVLQCARDALERARRDGPAIWLHADSFAACNSISIDYAVMEKTDRAAVVPLRSDWADIGSWSEVWRLGVKDARGNVVHGRGQLMDCNDSLVWSETKMVTAIGLSDVIVVQTEDAVLVLPKSRAQEVKLLVEQLKAGGPKP